jgi:acetyl esterase/lipase
LHTLAYGPGPDQVGDLYLPATPRAPLVCLFHGGFWRVPYGPDQLQPVAVDLCTSGLAVWNLGYRRVGPGGHPWPATLQDVEAAVTYLPTLQQAHPQVDLARLVLVGHSAGGHLAFWAASTAKRLSRPLPPTAAIGLAPLLDLDAVYAAGLGNRAVELFLGGSPSTVPERYQQASPAAQLPLGVRQYVFHGEADAAVPPSLSQAYVAKARAAGDDVTYVLLKDADHMAFIDLGSQAYRVFRRLLLSAA